MSSSPIPPAAGWQAVDGVNQSLTPAQTRSVLFTHIDCFFREQEKDLLRPPLSPARAALPQLRVAVVKPSSRVEPWVYLSVGAWELFDDGSGTAAAPRQAQEFMLMAPGEDMRHVAQISRAIDAALAAGQPLEQGAIVPLGRPWIEGGVADHLLVTLPYPFGHALECCELGLVTVRYRWLLPITRAETDYCREHGVEALEQRFESAAMDFMAANRGSVV